MQQTLVLPSVSERAALLARLPDPPERRAIRERSGYTLREVGAALEVSPTSVQRWELGERPSRRTLPRYVQLLEHLSTARAAEGVMRDGAA